MKPTEASKNYWVERYEREAQGRMAERIGESLAEEFFSVARDTSKDTVSVAELMAAAYKMGKNGWPPHD